MKFYSLHMVAGGSHGDWCFCSTQPTGIGPSIYRIQVGQSLGDLYPAGPDGVEWQLSNACSSMKKPSLLGNTCHILAVHSDVAATIRAYEAEPLEVLSFILMNHRGRVHSTDYVFMNPIGSVDCLHTTQSKIIYATSGEVIHIDRIVLDKEKVKNCKVDLFRIREDPMVYVISERLANAFERKRFTNIVLSELEVA